MKNIFKNFSAAFLGSLFTVLLFGGVVFAATVLPPSQGGTGTTTKPQPGQIPMGTAGNVYTPAYIACSGCMVTTSSGGISITVTASGGGSFNATGTPKGLLIFTGTNTGTSSANLFFSTSTNVFEVLGLTSSTRLFVSGTSSFQSNIDASSTLKVQSGTDLRSTLNVASAVNNSSTVTTQGNEVLRGTLDVASATNMSSTLTLQGNAQFRGTLTLSLNNDAVSTSTGANPSAQVTTAAVNGSANTFMRSDAAPAVNLTMAPTWTGFHQFNTAGASTTQLWSVSSTLNIVNGITQFVTGVSSTQERTPSGTITGLFFANATGSGSLSLGSSWVLGLVGNPLNVGGNLNTQIQANVSNAHASGTADWVLTEDNGNDSSRYADFFINNSQYNVAAQNITAAGDAGILVSDGSFAINIATTGAKYFLVGTGGSTNTSTRFRISTTGLTEVFGRASSTEFVTASATITVAKDAQGNNFTTSTPASLAGAYLGVSGNSLTVSSTLASSSISFNIYDATTTIPYRYAKWRTQTAIAIDSVSCDEQASAATTTIELYRTPTLGTTTVTTDVVASIVCGNAGQTTTVFVSSTLLAKDFLIANVSSTAGTPTWTVVNVFYRKQ